jgi:hypothetical protein
MIKAGVILVDNLGQERPSSCSETHVSFPTASFCYKIGGKERQSNDSHHITSISIAGFKEKKEIS